MIHHRWTRRVTDVGRGARSEQGSLPLVMLAAIILGGLIAALYSQVNSGQLTARADRDYQGAIQVADAGVQAAYVELATLDPDASDVPEVGGFYPTGDEVRADVVGDPDDATVRYVTSDVGEGAYRWRAKRIERTLWQVRSTGIYRDGERYVESLIGEQPIFSFALFGNDPLDLSKGGGNNDIDSLNDTIARLGSNGPMALQTQLLAKVPDGLILECFGDDAAENCPEEAVTNRTPIPFEDLAKLAYGEGGDCFDPETGTTVDDGILDAEWYETNSLVEGEVYCFSQVLFEAGGSLGTVGYPLEPATPASDEPTRIFINPAGDTRASQGGGAGGGDSVGLHISGTGQNLAEVNWLASGETDPKALTSRASDLLIFVPGTRTVTFDNNSSRVAAGIFAPFSTCDLRAQGTVVGALICGAIEGSGGGWNLIYDDRLQDYSLDDVYGVLSWSEQPEGLSSFEW